MEIMTMILGIALFVTGFGLMDYNTTHNAKHNILIGLGAFGFMTIGFMLIVYRFIS